MKGRQISDCICLASEAVNLLKYHSLGGNMVMKFDVRKAFHMLDWNFLLQVLKAFGFDEKFISWIHSIVSANLSLSVNGSAAVFFDCKRGIRQGDPLSPPFILLG